MKLLDDGRLWEVPRCSATSMDVRFALRHGGADTTGLAVLDCRGQEGPRSAAIVYDWHTDELRVTYNEYLVHTKRETFRWGFWSTACARNWIAGDSVPCGWLPLAGAWRP